MKLSILFASAAIVLGAHSALAQQVYPTPDDAAKDLIDAAKAGTPGFAVRIFGQAGKDLLSSGDAVTDADNVATFNTAAAATMAIDDGPDGQKLLRVGNNGWTLPIPLVKTDAGWHFDAAKGKEVMVDREVGFNELSAIEACRAYKQAQDDYFELDRDGNGVREYAQRIISSPDKHDGLYWPPEDQSDLSPLDGFAQDAAASGNTPGKGEPYNGYIFRVLTAQGPAAPGGAHAYLINGLMIAGHALVAWPADYGKSGVQTFTCGENGVIYQKDLGANTASLGAAMTQFNPDDSWKPVE